MKCRAVKVSNTPGHTKICQEVKIDKMLRVIDSPGIILSNENEIDLLLRNTIKAKDV